MTWQTALSAVEVIFISKIMKAMHYLEDFGENNRKTMKKEGFF
jgi:hypothetical protein